MKYFSMEKKVLVDWDGNFWHGDEVNASWSDSPMLGITLLPA